MNNDNNNKSSGIGFLGILQVVFITLKLCKIINWSWFWVLTPIWGQLVIVVIVMIIVPIVLIIKKIRKKGKK